jgi:integrase
MNWARGEAESLGVWCAPPHVVTCTVGDVITRCDAKFVGLTDGRRCCRRRISTRDTRFHDLRHTHASELLRRGVPLRTVSQRLGHANPTVTRNIYAHVMSGDDERAADTVEEMIKKQLEKKKERRS